MNDTSMTRHLPHHQRTAADGPRQTRASFLRQSAAAMAVTLAGQAAAGPSEAPAGDASDAPGWIDAHVHVWTPDVDAYPLAEGYRRQQMQPPSFTPDELFEHSRPEGVRRVVLIQMSFYGFDNRYMTDTMASFPGVFSGVAVIDHHAANVPQRMRSLAEAGVRGFRIHRRGQDVEQWIGSAAMAAMWQAAAEQRLAICPLINPEALPAIQRMCRRFPQTRVVVDHFARIGIDGQVRADQLDMLCRLADFPNVFVKTSAFYALGQKQPPYTDLAPMIRRLVGVFGAERLMWASDCPFQVGPGHSYAASLALIRDRLEFLDDDQRRWMLRGTAEKVYFTNI